MTTLTTTMMTTPKTMIRCEQLHGKHSEIFTVYSILHGIRQCKIEFRHIYSILHDLHTIILNMDKLIFDITWLANHINSNIYDRISHIISNIVYNLRIWGIYIRFYMTYHTIENRISPSKIEFLDIRY